MQRNNILKNLTDKEMIDIYREKNNAGLGFSVGEETDQITEIEGIGDLLEVFQELALYSGESGEGPLVLVGDCNGPWAVEI